MSYPIPSTLFSSELTALQEEVMIYEVVDRMPEGSPQSEPFEAL